MVVDHLHCRPMMMLAGTGLHALQITIPETGDRVRSSRPCTTRVQGVASRAVPDASLHDERAEHAALGRGDGVGNRVSERRARGLRPATYQKKGAVNLRKFLEIGTEHAGT